MTSVLQKLFENGKIKTYSKEDIIIYEGDPVVHLHHIDSGYVKVFNFINSGNERIIFIYGPGDVFPLTTHLSRRQAVGNFYAAMTDVQVRMIEPRHLEQQLKDDIDKGEMLINYAYDINQQFFQRIDILSVNDARHKLVSLLVFLVQKAGSGTSLVHIDIPLTHQDIANMSGLARESVSRQMALLKKEGVVQDSRSLAIDPVRLRKMGEDLAITT